MIVTMTGSAIRRATTTQIASNPRGSARPPSHRSNLAGIRCAAHAHPRRPSPLSQLAALGGGGRAGAGGWPLAEPRPRLDARAHDQRDQPLERRVGSTSRGASASTSRSWTRARSRRRRWSPAAVVYVQDMRSNVFALDLASGRAACGGARFGAHEPGAERPRASPAAASTARPTRRCSRSRPRTASCSGAASSSPRRRGSSTSRRRSRTERVYIEHDRPAARRAAASSTRSTRGRARCAGSSTRSRAAGRCRPRRAAAARGTRRASTATTVFWGTANPYPYGGTRSASERRRVRGRRALHRLAARARRARRGKLALVRPGDAARRPRPRLPALAGPRLERRTRRRSSAPARAASSSPGTGRPTGGSGRPRSASHRNDSGPLPPHRVPVCPGLLGGVETPMAYADGRLYRPGRRPLRSRQRLRLRGPLRGRRRARGTGELVALDAATGKRLWRRRLPQPDFGCATVGDGVVFTSTFDGTVYGARRRLPAPCSGRRHAAGGRQRLPGARLAVAPRTRGHPRTARRRHGARRADDGLTENYFGSWTVPSACGASCGSELG